MRGLTAAVLVAVVCACGGSEGTGRADDGAGGGRGSPSTSGVGGRGGSGGFAGVGGTTSGSGGSSSSGLYCSAASSCPGFACRCADGTAWTTARYCLNNVCQGTAATCANACKDNLGVAGSSSAPTPTTPTVPYVYGCTLSKWSNDNSVTAQMYGSDSSRGVALSDAAIQCAAANWTSAFCGAATDSCVQERAVPTSCTFSKWSSSSSTTIRFYGSGLGATAAKAAAVDACLRSGAWRGWFCTSGSLSCTVD